MPPNRRKKFTKNGSIETNRVADDEIFESDEKLTKKPFKRFKASAVARQKLRSNNKSLSDTNHVEMKRKNSSSPEIMGNKSPATIDSDQVNST